MRQAVQASTGRPAGVVITSSMQHLLAGVGGLDVVFQPMFEFKAAGSMVHAIEGLIRGPKGTHLEQPDRLFGFFRPRGQGLQLDALCLDTILQRAGTLPGTPRICLNVGAQSVLEPGFLGTLLESTDKFEVSPYRLILDIGLDHDHFDQSRLAPAIAQIRRFGIRIAYDENAPFATGFQLLMDAAPDYLKLHHSVIRRQAGDVHVQRTLAATVNLGQMAGFRVVAKGVESLADVETVRGHGIDLVQGYHCARPAGVRDPRIHEFLRGVPGAWDDQFVR